VHVGRSLNSNVSTCAVQVEVLLNESVVFFNQTAFTVCVHRRLHLLVFVSAEEVTLHGVDLFLLCDFLLLQSFVDVVLDPGKVLLGGIAKREDVFVLGHDIVLEVFVRGALTCRFAF